jgi:tRNA(Ile2) C34 agmatinyltransferase TiaS
MRYWQEKITRKGEACMGKAVLLELGMSGREDAMAFLKRLWNEEPTPCPKCGGILAFLHKKEKKSNCDWKCPRCGAIYRTMDLLNRLNEP